MCRFRHDILVALIEIDFAELEILEKDKYSCCLASMLIMLAHGVEGWEVL